MGIRRGLREAVVPLGVAAVAYLEWRDLDGDLLRGAVLAVACGVLVPRRVSPMPVMAAVSAAGAAYVAVMEDRSAQPPLALFLALIVGFFALGAHAPRRDFAIGLGAAGLLMGPAMVATVVAGRPATDTVPSLLFWGAACTAGRLLHHRGRQVDAAQAAAERAAQDRDQHAQRAAAEERSRIARELHDVIAHSLSVMVIQASVEARLRGDRDDSTTETLRTIESVGREALVELRRLLGLLRVDDSRTDGLAPLPSLDQLDDLLSQARAAGLDVGLTIAGERRSLPPGIDLSAYRIVQEALTNALKHAPGARTEVRVDYAPDELTVEVGNAAGGAGRLELVGSGHGLVGMRERIRLYDGDLEAGPDADGGFRVRARIPAATAAGEEDG